MGAVKAKIKETDMRAHPAPLTAIHLKVDEWMTKQQPHHHHRTVFGAMGSYICL